MDTERVIIFILCIHIYLVANLKNIFCIHITNLGRYIFLITFDVYMRDIRNGRRGNKPI